MNTCHEKFSLLADDFEPRWSDFTADQIRPAIGQALAQAQAKLEGIIEQDRSELSYESTFAALEEATAELERGWGRLMHLDAVNDHEAQREAIREMLPKVSEFFSSIPLNGELWKVLKCYAESEDREQLSAVKQRFVAETVADFISSGADLEEEEKKRVAALKADLSAWTKSFSENVLDSTNAWELVIDDEAELAGLPENAKEAALEDAIRKGLASEGAATWRFTLQAPSMMPVMQYADSDELRQRIWQGACSVGNVGEYHNEDLIWKILQGRQELAELLGKAHFADLVLERRMAKSGSQALEFVEGLHRRIAASFGEEIEALQAYRAEVVGDECRALEPWEVAYWSEHRRRALFDFDEEELRPFFQVDRVMKGMFSLCENLFQLRIVEKSAAAAMDGGTLAAETHETWHPECKYYEIFDADGKSMLGAFYADWHPREEKRGGAWMNPLDTGKRMADGSKTPHLGVIVGNMTKPVKGKPALLTHREVETIFHEFGHLLHHLLGDVEVAALSGTNVPWDFVELPSQIMENFCWERESLDLFARHYETGEVIPEVLFKKMLSARNYQAATTFMRQLSFGKLDLELHTRLSHYRNRSLQDVDDEILAGYKFPTRTKGPSMALRFSHLFSSPTGYAAGYYSYKWAEVLDADAFTRFQAEGLLNPEVGREFRDSILSQGNSRPPEELYREFMGRDPDPNALLIRAGLA